MTISNNGHVYFLDVTVDFVKRTKDHHHHHMGHSSDSNLPTTIPQIQTRFGALIKRRQRDVNSPYDHEHEPTKGNEINRLGQEQEREQRGENENANANGTHEKGATYIQTNVLTREILEEYATDIRILLNDTGPIEMANILSQAFLPYNTSTPTCTHSVHTLGEDIGSGVGVGEDVRMTSKKQKRKHTQKKKKKQTNLNNNLPPPSMKLRTVMQLVDPDNWKQENNAISNPSYSSYTNIIMKDRIGIHHMDLMEEGLIRFPCRDNGKQQDNNGYIGEIALQMIVSNLLLHDERQQKQQQQCENDYQCEYSNDYNNCTNGESTHEHIINPNQVFQSWWNNQIRWNNHVKEEEEEIIAAKCTLNMIDVQNKDGVGQDKHGTPITIAQSSSSVATLHESHSNNKNIVANINIKTSSTSNTSNTKIETDIAKSKKRKHGITKYGEHAMVYTSIRTKRERRKRGGRITISKMK